MRQFNMFTNTFEEGSNNYTKKITAPIYEPKNIKPSLIELFDKTTTIKLMKKIDESNVSYDEKLFLLEAAKRHTIFNYEKIADYYAHASEEMKELMQESALVIIDFDRAIELEFVNLTKEIKEQYLQEYSNE